MALPNQTYALPADTSTLDAINDLRTDAAPVSEQNPEGVGDPAEDNNDQGNAIKATKAFLVNVWSHIGQPGTSDATTIEHRLAAAAEGVGDLQVDVSGLDTRLAAVEAVASGSAISGTFGAAETDVPGASLVTRARTNVNLRAVGGGQGDAIELYVLAEADYLAHQAALADYLDSISADLTLTITAQGFATGTLAQAAAGSFVAAMRVGASVAAPIYLYETAS